MLSVTLLAYAMIVVFMVLVMSGRVSALIALILVPLAFGALAGFGGDLGKMSLDGIRTWRRPACCCSSPSCISG